MDPDRVRPGPPTAPAVTHPRRASVPDPSPVLPPRTLPPAPVSPDVEIDAGVDAGVAIHPDTISPDAIHPDAIDPGLGRVLEAFRLLQVRHARLLAQQSSLRGLGVTDTRFLVHLSAIEGQATTPKHAGDLLELSTGAMTSLLDRLERHGHLERRPNPVDRRSILVHLTPSGAAVAREVTAVYAEVFAEAVAPARRPGLAATLEGVGAALDRRQQAGATPAAGAPRRA